MTKALPAKEAGRRGMAEAVRAGDWGGAA